MAMSAAAVAVAVAALLNEEPNHFSCEICVGVALLTEQLEARGIYSKIKLSGKGRVS